MKRVKIILGSVRTDRAGIKVAQWVNSQVKEFEGDLDFEFIDFKRGQSPLHG